MLLSWKILGSNKIIKTTKPPGDDGELGSQKDEDWKGGSILVALTFSASFMRATPM